MSDTQNSTAPERSWFEFFKLWLHERPFRYFHRVCILILLLTLFRAGFVNCIELVADEAYYWLWSKNLDICYYSKGPGVAWTIAAGTAIWGDSEFGIRFFSLCLAAGTGLGLFFLGRRLFSPKVGFYAVILAAVTPLYAVGSVLMTIDPLSIFFWVWAAYCFWLARSTLKIEWWLVTGFLIGLGMLCKYTNIAQVLCFALFCLFSSKDRQHLLKPSFWLMVIAALSCLTPTILWNQRYDWITITHLLERGKIDSGSEFEFRSGEFIQFFQEQALAYSPLIFLSILVVMGWVLYRHFQRPKDGVHPFRTEWIFLFSLFAPLSLFYLALSTNEAGEANWTSPCYLVGFIALSAAYSHLRLSAWKKNTLRGAFLIGLIMTVLFHSAAWVDFTKIGLPDPLKRVRGSKHLALEVAKLQQTKGASLIIARRYQTASLLSYYLPGRPFVHVPSTEGIANQFSFWPSYTESQTGVNSALYISRDKEKPNQPIPSQFQGVTYIKQVNAVHQGRLIRPYYGYFCDTYIGGDDPTTP